MLAIGIIALVLLSLTTLGVWAGIGEQRATRKVLERIEKLEGK